MTESESDLTQRLLSYRTESDLINRLRSYRHEPGDRFEIVVKGLTPEEITDLTEAIEQWMPNVPVHVVIEE